MKIIKPKKGERHDQPPGVVAGDVIASPVDDLAAGDIARGVAAETAVACVLRDLKREGVITGWEKTGWADADDRAGVDFWIRLGHRRLALQVKAGTGNRPLNWYARRKILLVTNVGYGRDVRRDVEKLIVRAKCGIYRL